MIKNNFKIFIACLAILQLVVSCGVDHEEDAHFENNLVKWGEHKHAAYGIYVCDSFLPNLEDQESDRHGIHTHADGIIHIHPFSVHWAEKNATLEEFGTVIGISFSNDGFQIKHLMSDKNKYEYVTYKNGYDCQGKPASIKLFVWPADDLAVEPVVISENIGSYYFHQDREAITLAVLPDGAIPPRPPSVPKLDNLNDVIPK